MSDDPSVGDVGELRALVAQGPAVVMVAKASMLAILDEREALRAEVERLRLQAGVTGLEYRGG
jgi:hypothetical protein